MQRRVEREQRILSQRMKEVINCYTDYSSHCNFQFSLQEREKHQKQLEVLQKELREIKMVVLSGMITLWFNLPPTIMQEFGREPEMKQQAVQGNPLAPIQSSSSNQPGIVNLYMHTYQIFMLSSYARMCVTALLLVDARQASSIASNNFGKVRVYWCMLCVLHQ